MCASAAVAQKKSSEKKDPSSASKKEQQKPKGAAALLQKALGKYRTGLYAQADTLLTQYAEEATNEPTEKRELASLVRVKCWLKLGRTDDGKSELLRLETALTSADLKQEAMFDLAATLATTGEAVAAARKWSAVAADWSPEDSLVMRRKVFLSLRLLALADLSIPDLKSLSAETPNLHLRAQLLSVLMEKSLAENDGRLRDAAIGLAEEFLKTGVGEPSRTQIDDLRQQALKRRSGSFKVLRVGALVPVVYDLYDGTEARPLGSKILEGIAFSVSEHNRTSPNTHLSLFVRNGGRDTLRLFAKAKELLDLNVDLILGPIYSAGATSVSKLCADKGITMMTPTATDDAITDGIKTSFQLNPTYSMRGRIAARYAVKELGAKVFGVMAEDSTYGVQMAEGFKAEALALGGDIKLFGLLPRKFSTITKGIEPLGLKRTKKGYAETRFDALYLPLTKPEQIDIAVNQLKFYNLKGRLIGSGDWHDVPMLNKLKGVADSIVYAIDSDVSSENSRTAEVTQRFTGKYRLAPDAYFWLGYDAAEFVIETLLEKGITDKTKLAESLRAAPPYQAHHTEIFFDGGNVNSRMNVMRFVSGTVARLTIK